MAAYTERVPLSFIEEKAACLVWHYRQSPAEIALFQSRKLDEELRVGFANQPVAIMNGAKIVEASAIECNKGSFLRWLMENESPSTLYLCIGDDRTYEEMFKVVRQRGLSIKVGAGHTRARYRLKGQVDVVNFLQALRKACLAGEISPAHPDVSEKTPVS